MTDIEGLVERLFPCPFCGGDAYLAHHDNDLPSWSARCATCCAEIEDREKTVALATWNTRAQPNPPQGREDLVLGPVWREEEEETECWTAEVQVVGGHYVVATVHGGSKAEATARADAILAALATPTISPRSEAAIREECAEVAEQAIVREFHPMFRGVESAARRVAKAIRSSVSPRGEGA